MGKPDALTLVIAALRRGEEGGDDVDVIDVPACDGADGNGDERWGEEDEIVVPLV